MGEDVTLHRGKPLTHQVLNPRQCLAEVLNVSLDQGRK